MSSGKPFMYGQCLFFAPQNLGSDQQLEQCLGREVEQKKMILYLRSRCPSLASWMLVGRYWHKLALGAETSVGLLSRMLCCRCLIFAPTG